MVHPTYRYLERSTRLAGLTWRQWVLLCVGGLATYLLAKALPLPAPYGVSAALTLCGTPAAVTMALAGTDAQLALTPHVLVAWRASRGVHLPAVARAPLGGDQTERDHGVVSCAADVGAIAA